MEVQISKRADLVMAESKRSGFNRTGCFELACETAKETLEGTDHRMPCICFEQMKVPTYMSHTGPALVANCEPFNKLSNDFRVWTSTFTHKVGHLLEVQ